MKSTASDSRSGPLVPSQKTISVRSGPRPPQRYPAMILFCLPGVIRPESLPWGKTHLPGARHPSRAAIFWRLGGPVKASLRRFAALTGPPSRQERPGTKECQNDAGGSRLNEQNRVIPGERRGRPARSSRHRTTWLGSYSESRQRYKRPDRHSAEILFGSVECP